MPASTRAALRAFTPLLASLALGLSGCGGGDSAKTTTSSGDDSDAGRVKLTQCLRDNGVDVPDNPGSAGPGAGGAQNIDRDKLQAAMQGPCKKYQTGAFGNLSDEDRQEMQDAFQKFSQCMRDEGVDVPDVNPGSGGGPPAGGNQIDQDDPKVQQAMKACQSELPQGGRPGGQ